MARKRSFFEKLTGAVKLDDDYEHQRDEMMEEEETREELAERPKPAGWSEEEIEGELTVDVYQTPTHIVLKTMVAGVRPDDIEVHIARDVVTIKGKREDEKEIRDEDYYHRELYWGAFSRTVILPQEVEPDEAEAIERHGLLIIKIPKIDKHRHTKVKVKSN
jgi:HSP20 family protein